MRSRGEKLTRPPIDTEHPVPQGVLARGAMPFFVFRAVDGRGKLVLQVGKPVGDDESIGKMIQIVMSMAPLASFVLGRSSYTQTAR